MRGICVSREVYAYALPSRCGWEHERLRLRDAQSSLRGGCCGGLLFGFPIDEDRLDAMKEAL